MYSYYYITRRTPGSRVITVVPRSTCAVRRVTPVTVMLLQPSRLDRTRLSVSENVLPIRKYYNLNEKRDECVDGGQSWTETYYEKKKTVLLKKVRTISELR